MTAHSTITLATAIEVLLRVLAVLRLRRPLPQDADLAALGAAMPCALGAEWGFVYRALAAAREDLEAHGPLSSRRGAPNDEHVTAALLRGEAIEAVDGVLAEVAGHYLPLSRGWLLCDVAARVERAAGEAMERAGVRDAWLLVYRAVHQRRSSGVPTLQPGEAGDEGDEGPTTERTVPELVVELPAIGVGPGVDRRLAALARELRDLLALQADAAPRGRGLVLRLRVPVESRRERHALRRAEGL